MSESAGRSTMDDARFFPLVREGQVVAGKYLVGTQLGRGGMGIVHAALDQILDRRVALKVLLPRLVSSPTAAQRFLREARAATRITSEHAVKLLDIDTLPDGTPLLVMEHLEGRDLRAVLMESGPLPAREAVDHLLQALQAVAEGHTQAIIHRDLKPSNLFLTERADGTPLIKVLDFGIAKTLRAENQEDFTLTSSEDMQLGSPTYMPPEQFQNPRDVDARADIWALGVTLYELISGKQPFHGDSYAELVSRVLSAPPESLKLLLPGVSLPDGLDQIIAKCLEKKRERRYNTALELAVALAPFGSDDARLSLNRVSGLVRPRSPNAAGLVRDSMAAYEATVPVPLDDAPDRHTATSSGARPTARSSSRRRLGLTVAILTGLLIAASIIWQVTRIAEPRPIKAPRPLTPSMSSLQPVATESTQAKKTAPQPGTESGKLTEVDLNKTAVIAKVLPAKPPAQQRPTTIANIAKPGPVVTAPLGSAPPDANSDPQRDEVGPSDRIEKLIEQRH